MSQKRQSENDAAMRTLLPSTEAPVLATEDALREREQNLQAREAALLAREAAIEAREQRMQELEAEIAAQQSPARAMADDAEEEERDARDALEAAEAAAGDASLGEARRMLAELGAKSAAIALLAITAVDRTYGGDALIAIKNAERNIRDVVALRCRSRTNPADRDAWLRTAEEAFGNDWNDRDVKASLRLAYSKVAQNRPDTSFLSNNQITTARRLSDLSGRRLVGLHFHTSRRSPKMRRLD